MIFVGSLPAQNILWNSVEHQEMCLVLQRNPAQVVFSHPSGCVGQIRTKPKESPAAARASSGFFLPRGFPVIQKCFLSWKNPGQGLSSRKSDLQEDLPWTKDTQCLPRVPTGMVLRKVQSLLLLTQNKDFTWKKQNLAKQPGLQNLP